MPEFKDLDPATPNWPALIAARSGGGLLHVGCDLGPAVLHSRGRLAYLATPYSLQVVGADGAFDELAAITMVARAARWVRLLALEGVTATSPIVQAGAILDADIIESEIDPLCAAFWTRWCDPLLAASGCVIVPPIDGWDVSVGVWGEVLTALSRNVPVFLLSDGGVA